MENLSISVDLLRNLAPEYGIEQDEQGGCVWCGGRGLPVAEDHGVDCPWLAARRLLSLAGEPLTLRAAYPDDPALLRIIASRADNALTTLTQAGRGERARDALRRRTFQIIEDGPDRCVGVIVFDRPMLLRTGPLTISYLYVEPSYREGRQDSLEERLIHSVTSEADRMGFTGVQLSDQAAAAAPNSDVFNF
jgi:hypothetical protein